MLIFSAFALEVRIARVLDHDDAAVGGRKHHVLALRDVARRIAEELQDEEREQRGQNASEAEPSQNSSATARTMPARNGQPSRAMIGCGQFEFMSGNPMEGGPASRVRRRG